MSKKFQLPHSEEAIASVRADIDRLKTQLKAAEDLLYAMQQTNYQAGRAEEKRQAQKLTPATRALLMELAKDNTYLWIYHSSRDLFEQQDGGGRKFKHYMNIRESTFDRLRIAGYIERTQGSDWRDSVFAITDTGRAALGAAAPGADAESEGGR